MNRVLPEVPSEVAALLGDPHPLIEQLGARAGLAVLPWAERWGEEPIHDAAGLGRFLEGYTTEILAPVELPAIARAFRHGERGELRELLGLDGELAGELRLRPLAAASRTAGRSQLRRLLPLRDVRWIRRYWQAAERGEAHVWHVLVYGITLALFSLPLRPGLSHYAHRTVSSLIESAAGPLGLDSAVRATLEDRLSARLGPMVAEALGPADSPPRLLAI